MPVDVNMPRLSDSMDSGTIVRWLKADGDAVAPGDELVEIETDKATTTCEAEGAGTLSIAAAEGEAVAVGAPIARLLGAGEETPASPPPAAPPAAANGRLKASPVARRIAARRGLDLALVRGSGPGGRIVKRDVEDAPAAAPAPAPAAPPAAGDGDRFEPFTSVQATIARRMVQAQAAAPDFQVTMSVDMGAAADLRAAAAAAADDRRAPFSYNDLVIKACATALRRHPRVNASAREDGVVLHERVDVGVAVAAPGTLLVPTVAGADALALTTIAAATRALAAAARAGTLTPAQLSPGTFTVSNLGMLGVTHFTAVLNPPQTAILAVGAVERRAAVRDGALTIATMMNMTLTSDHRVLYGADAAAFLAEVKALLETPLRLLL